MIRFTNSLAAKLFEIEYTVFFTAIYVDYVDRNPSASMFLCGAPLTHRFKERSI